MRMQGDNQVTKWIVVKWLKFRKMYLSLELQSVRIQHVFRIFISIETKRALVGSFRTGGSKCIILVCAGLAQEWFSMWSQNRSPELYATDSDIVEMPAQTLSTNVCFAVWAADFPSSSSEPETFKHRKTAHTNIDINKEKKTFSPGYTACAPDRYWTNLNRWQNFSILYKIVRAGTAGCAALCCILDLQRVR